MNTVLKKQILGALCWEQKDSFKNLLLSLVYRIFLFLEPSKVFSIIHFPNVFIFARIKPCSILRRTVPSAMILCLVGVKHYLRKLAMTFLSLDLSQRPPIPPGLLLPPCFFLCLRMLQLLPGCLAGTPAAFSLTPPAPLLLNTELANHNANSNQFRLTLNGAFLRHSRTVPAYFLSSISFSSVVSCIISFKALCHTFPVKYP